MGRNRGGMMQNNTLLQFTLIIMWLIGMVIAEHHTPSHGILAFICPPYAWYRLVEFILLYFNII